MSRNKRRSARAQSVINTGSNPAPGTDLAYKQQTKKSHLLGGLVHRRGDEEQPEHPNTNSKRRLRHKMDNAIDGIFVAPVPRSIRLPITTMGALQSTTEGQEYACVQQGYRNTRFHLNDLQDVIRFGKRNRWCATRKCHSLEETAKMELLWEKMMAMPRLMVMSPHAKVQFAR